VLGILLLVAIGFVAFTNGANANFKGVASLYGSGTTSLRTALYWGTATTFAGSLTAALLAQGLLKTFGGKGLVPDELAQATPFLTSVALAAALTSFLATRFGFPVSTTHALVGALAGAGLVGAGDQLHLGALGKNFIYPLFVSPILAAGLGAVLYGVLRVLKLAPDHRTKTLDVLHFLSAGGASFARGLNDTPKIAALLAASPYLDTRWGIPLIAAIIALGGLLDAKNVTDMNPGQGFAASLSTSALVIAASVVSLPVSTTHVSVGSLLGIGAVTRQAKWRKAGEIMLAWISTVPCGAVLAAIFYLIISRVASN
jgi:PiT family inorganic phosphate transporter